MMMVTLMMMMLMMRIKQNKSPRQQTSSNSMLCQENLNEHDNNSPAFHPPNKRLNSYIQTSKFHENCWLGFEKNQNIWKQIIC